MHAQLMFSQLIGSQIVNDGFMSSYIAIIVVLSGLPLISCMVIKIDEGRPGVILPEASLNQMIMIYII